MKILLCILLSASCSRGLAQQAVDWYLYEDTATQLSYYRDACNITRTRPLHFLSGGPGIFSAIIPVIESNTDTGYNTFYLLRNGREVGHDSLYFWDNVPDCEREGKIRFRDRISDRVGVFDQHGKVVVPPVYNDMTPFNNGLAWAIRGAGRECWEGGKYDVKNPCEHWAWKGGVRVLINSKNETLAEVTEDKDVGALDLYSLRISDHISDTSLRVFLKGINGKYYSFINQEKEFERWLQHTFMQAAHTGRLEEVLPELVMQERGEGRAFIAQDTFIARFGQILKKKIARLEAGQVHYDIVADELNAYIFGEPAYSRYYDNCGNFLRAKYPAYGVLVTYYATDGKMLCQEHFGFLKTDQGYRLVYVSMI